MIKNPRQQSENTKIINSMKEAPPILLHWLLNLNLSLKEIALLTLNKIRQNSADLLHSLLTNFIIMRIPASNRVVNAREISHKREPLWHRLLFLLSMTVRVQCLKLQANSKTQVPSPLALWTNNEGRWLILPANPSILTQPLIAPPKRECLLQMKHLKLQVVT